VGKHLGAAECEGAGRIVTPHASTHEEEEEPTRNQSRRSAEAWTACPALRRPALAGRPPTKEPMLRARVDLRWGRVDLRRGVANQGPGS